MAGRPGGGNSVADVLSGKASPFGQADNDFPGEV